MKGLSGKAVLVTGGGGAIGSAICTRFAEAGATLLVADVNEESCKKTARAVNGKALVFDISKYDEAKKAIGSETVDILVNNAGWDRFQNFLDTSPAEWDQLLDINLRGPLNMHHIVVPQMMKRGSGRVINISSDAGRTVYPGLAVYSASKFFVVTISTLVAALARVTDHVFSKSSLSMKTGECVVIKIGPSWA